jgi:hypothetical protein
MTPKHLRALELDYEEYIRLNGGEHCGICGSLPKTRKLHRDHWHSGPLSGKPRGLVCWPCNRQLSYYITVEWLMFAMAYLRRSEDREDRFAHTDVGA